MLRIIFNIKIGENLMYLNYIVSRLLLLLFSVFPIKNNKIIFCSYFGTKYACNPRAISEYMVKNYPKLDIVWVLPSNVRAPKGTRIIHRRSLKYFYEFATARIWVDNCRKPLWMRKRNGQFYVQTWHGGISLKKVEAGAKKLPSHYIKSAKHDSQLADLFLSNSDWLSKEYRNYFFYNGKILQYGLPREDKLLNSKKNYYHEKICNYFNCPNNTKFLLYAPTFRDDGNILCYDMKYEKLINSLNSMNENWKIIVRLHPNITNKIEYLEFNNNILNGTFIDDINDLILGSDIVVSDYSSCMFDAAIAQKKTIIYASDIDKYSKDRGFMFDFDELPFPLTKNTDELINCINNWNDIYYKINIQKFLKACGFGYNKTSSKDVSEFLIKTMVNSIEREN